MAEKKSILVGVDYIEISAVKHPVAPDEEPEEKIGNVIEPLGEIGIQVEPDGNHLLVILSSKVNLKNGESIVRIIGTYEFQEPTAQLTQEELNYLVPNELAPTLYAHVYTTQTELITKTFKTDPGLPIMLPGLMHNMSPPAS